MTSHETSKFGAWLYKILIKYWIFISTGMLLLMSCQNEVVAYRIVYMILFLYFISTFQVSKIKHLPNKTKIYNIMFKFFLRLCTSSGDFLCTYFKCL